MVESTEQLVELRDLTKRFRRGWGPTVEALRGVSFSVPRGEIFGLLGPNGAGKTTIIKILLGIIRMSSGQARLLGYPAGDRRGRMRVGYLPENLQIPAHQTAHTALDYYGRLSGLSRAEIRERRGKLLDTVGLSGRERESVRQFSKGMRQRLGLAQALLHDPDLLILDEPTDGLDPVGRNEVRQILQRLRDERRTVFLNSHLLQEVELVTDRVAILDRGQLRFEGALNELTPESEGEVLITLCAIQSQVEQVLDSLEVDYAVVAAENGTVRISVPFDAQADVDRLIDALRGDGISIYEIAHRRPTLEDAFLSLIASPAEVVS